MVHSNFESINGLNNFWAFLMESSLETPSQSHPEVCFSSRCFSIQSGWQSRLTITHRKGLPVQILFGLFLAFLPLGRGWGTCHRRSSGRRSEWQF
jgi:hypothetical protein